MNRLVLLLFCLLAACAPRPENHRALEVYLSTAGGPGLELPALLPITHPLLLRRTLAGADSFRQELGAWLQDPRLHLVDARELELPRHGLSRELASGQVSEASWTLETRRRGGARQVRLHVSEGGRESLGGWSELVDQEDLVLGMPLAGGAGLLLRLPPAGASQTHGEPALPDSLLTKAPFRELASPPEVVGGFAALVSRFKYPPGAARDGLEGTVLLALLVDTRGGIRQIELLRGVRADLDSAAKGSLEGVTFTPAHDEHGPVATWVTLPVRFKLAVQPTER